MQYGGGVIVTCKCAQRAATKKNFHKINITLLIVNSNKSCCNFLHCCNFYASKTRQHSLRAHAKKKMSLHQQQQTRFLCVCCLCAFLGLTTWLRVAVRRRRRHKDKKSNCLNAVLCTHKGFFFKFFFLLSDSKKREEARTTIKTI